MSVEHYLAKFATQEREEAELEGLSLEDYRSKCEAEAQARDDERKLKEEWQRRSDRLAPMARHMTSGAFCAVVENTLKQTATLTFVKGWLRTDDSPPMAVLTGHTGCGKTVAAGWALCRTHGGEYVHARELASRYMPYSHDESRGIEPMNMNARIVVLDDMGTERRSRDGQDASDDRFTEAFSMLLETRQSSSLITIITTNLTPERFIETYCRDPRDKSRLVSMAVFCKGGREDMRK